MARPSGVNMVPRVAEFTRLLSTYLLTNFLTCPLFVQIIFINTKKVCLETTVAKYQKSSSWNHSCKVLKWLKGFFGEILAQDVLKILLCSAIPSLVLVASLFLPAAFHVLVSKSFGFTPQVIFSTSASASVRNMFRIHLQVSVIFVPNCTIHNRLPWYL